MQTYADSYELFVIWTAAVISPTETQIEKAQTLICKTVDHRGSNCISPAV